MSDAAVIVPTATGGERLRRLLASVAAADGHPVIVVDNASGDPELARLQQRFPAVEVLRLERNVGFGRAINAAARATGAEALVLVNDDCVCDPGYVQALASRLDPAAGVVMAAGVLREARDPSLIDTAGIEVDRTLLAFDYLNGEPLSVLEGGVGDPLGPCGGAAAYYRDAFLELGGFDEGLFAFWEDVDLALRMRLAGARCVLAPDARATHEHSGTLGSGSARKNYLMGFGRGYVLRKFGVLSPRRAPGVLLRDATVCAGQAVFDRNLAGVRGRLAGWRSARPARPYPRALVEAFRPPGGLATLRDRAARRARLRSGPAGASRDPGDAPGRARAAAAPAPALHALAILHVAGPSGPARSLEGRLRWLAETGTVDVAVPGAGEAADAYRDFADVHELPYEALTLPSGPLAALGLARRVREEARRLQALVGELGPDVVVVATAMLPAAQIAARREGAPVVLEAAELLAWGRSPLRRFAGRALVGLAGRRADVVLACSRAVAAQYRGSGAPVVSAHPPIEERYAGGDGSGFRARHGIPAEARLILAVGSLTRMRGQDVLIESLARVPCRGPLACAIVGEPFPRSQDLAFAERLRELARAAAAPVRLIPHEARIADAYAAADVVVNPVRDPEAFGRVACEALLAGAPVVASRTGAVPEVLRDGETALLVEPGSAGALAEAISKLLAEPALARRLVERGAADVRARFSPEQALVGFSEALAVLAAAPARSAPPSPP